MFTYDPIFDTLFHDPVSQMGVRARVIRIRQETYDRLKNSKFAGFDMDFHDVVTKSLDRPDELLERWYAKQKEKEKSH
jgi:hypothetical protein